MKKINVDNLDGLIFTYFGMDYELHGPGDSIESQVNVWIAETPAAYRQGLIDDIEQFYREADDLEKDFEHRYGFEFSPQLWGATTAEFLDILKVKVIESLSKEI
ncbi:contact-dependent growth inhibition system immunity protein [Erwinia sp. BNK-24-b]|uniref:contact-dependent growth inhibition system immunity protein n=1 Tax=unclassified Erwinia TaxID=2622719 RepID=UPI0039BFE30C